MKFPLQNIWHINLFTLKCMCYRRETYKLYVTSNTDWNCLVYTTMHGSVKLIYIIIKTIYIYLIVYT